MVAKAIELGRKRKRGRPAHAVLALRRQQFTFIAIQSDDEEQEQLEDVNEVEDVDVQQPVEVMSSALLETVGDDDIYDALQAALFIDLQAPTPDSIPNCAASEPWSRWSS